MRISDWSSDVCSSDLIQNRVGRIHDEAVELGHALGEFDISSRTADRHTRILANIERQCFGYIEARSFDQTPAHRSAVPHQEDRKSVVSGKSVSVRVDLGGRRIINKKTKSNKYI